MNAAIWNMSLAFFRSQKVEEHHGTIPDPKLLITNRSTNSEKQLKAMKQQKLRLKDEIVKLKGKSNGKEN